MDVINVNVSFAVATLDLGGYIRLYPPLNGWAAVFHRGNSIRSDVPRWDSLSEAKLYLYDDPERFVMEFSRSTGQCTGLWFTQDQVDAGIPARLDKWRGCYGSYPVKIMRPLPSTTPKEASCDVQHSQAQQAN